MIKIQTDELNYTQVETLVHFLNALNDVDHSVVIESDKNSKKFTITLSEV